MKSGFEIRYKTGSTNPYQVYLNGRRVRSFDDKGRAEDWLDLMENGGTLGKAGGLMDAVNG
jgi:hypothetical protein